MNAKLDPREQDQDTAHTSRPRLQVDLTFIPPTRRSVRHFIRRKGRVRADVCDRIHRTQKSRSVNNACVCSRDWREMQLSVHSERITGESFPSVSFSFSDVHAVVFEIETFF